MPDETPQPLATGEDVSVLHSANPLADWLWREGWAIGALPELARGLGWAMNAAGLPVFRVRTTLRTMHPQLAGLSHTWRRDTDEVEEFWPPLAVLQQDMFLKSPYALVFQGAGAVRRRLDLPDAVLDFPILSDLVAMGATDYVALPLEFSDGRISAITVATDRPGGFATAELQTLADAMPVLARLMEIHAMRRTARTVLDTYLGRLTGDRVLRGLIHRGDGEEIRAVIWFSDLRSSTALADALARQDYLDLLDDFFGVIAGAILAHGGDVLKFIGDAVLAIFPFGEIDGNPIPCGEPACACAAALAAVRDALGGMAALNARRLEAGQTPLRFGIGLHSGEVMYGNVGAPDRLDFTVIGPACNEAARLEAMSKVLERRVIVSADFVRLTPEPLSLISLGFHALRGIREARELFTLADADGSPVPPAP